MRERSEIEADLAVAVEPSPSDDAAYLTWHEAVLNLFEDVPALLAELDEVRAESERLRSSRSVELIDEQAAEIKRLVEMWKEAQSKENYEHGRVEEVRRERNAARVELDRAVAQVQRVEALCELVLADAKRPAAELRAEGRHMPAIPAMALMAGQILSALAGLAAPQNTGDPE